MAERFILNETSYFGRGCREVLGDEIRKRGYKRILFVTDNTLLKCGVAGKDFEFYCVNKRLIIKGKTLNISLFYYA